MIVPFLDLSQTYLELQEEIDQSISRVLHSGSYILGDEVAAFEQSWASYCSAEYAVGVGSGLDALVLALRAIDIRPGDEVIVPAHTFIATWLAVSAVGAVPVPVDPDPNTFNITAELIQPHITSRTRAIVPVHLYGQPVDLDPILLLAKSLNIFVIEDAAQAHGASYKQRRIGGHADLVCWSFYPGKNLGAFGDAGAITTNSLPMAERLRNLRNYGSTTKYIHNEKGSNSRLDPLQAAILGVKLSYLDRWNLRRQKIAQLYLDGLAGLPCTLPSIIETAQSSWHLFVIKCSKRDELMNHLSSNDIQTLIHYPIPAHRQHAFSGDGFPRMKTTEMIATQIVSLPIGPHMTTDQVHSVISHVKTFPF